MNAPVQIYLNWVFDKAAEKGLAWEQVDADAAGKMPLGPAMLADYVGLDTMMHTSNYYKQTLSPDFVVAKVIMDMINANNLGAKSGKGFYDWSQGRDAIKGKVKSAEPAGLFNLEYSMAIMLNEGCRILEEGIASGYKVIDDANMAGMNTPGPFSAGKKQYERWSKMLEDLAEQTGKDYLKPCELMKSGEFIKMRK